MRTLWQDLRYGARMLMQRPGFTLTAAVVLALGIGANTALFSVVHSVLFSPLSSGDAQRLVLIQAAWRSSSMRMNCSGPDYLDWVERNRVMEGLCAFATCQASLTGAGEPLAVQGFRTTVNFFDVVRADQMTLGRGFRPDEGHVGHPGVTVLSHSLWRDRYHADPNVLGQTIILDGAAYTVVGVAERRNEIGIRMALGAREQDVLRLVLRKAVALTVLGLLIGLACTSASYRFLASLLYGTSVYDPATFVTIPLLLFAVAVLACYFPARRAARINPMVALRYE
jgi:hypothetical protein